MEKELQDLALDLKKQYDELKKVNDQLTESLKVKADAALIDALNKKGEDLASTITALQGQVDAMEVANKQKGDTKSPKSWDAELLEGLKTKIMEFKAGKIQRSGKSDKDFGPHLFDMEVKTGTPQTVLTYGGSFDLRYATILPDRLPGVGRAPDAKPMLLDVVAQGATSSNQITWVERTARTEGSAAAAEAAVYGESLYTYQQKKAIVEKIPHFSKVTEEMMWDADFLVSEIKTEHIEQLRRKVDYYLLNGSGTSPQILGVLTNANAYTNTSLTGKVVAANRSDAVRAAINQIVELKYQPNYVFMNPADKALIELDKANTAERMYDVINGRLWGLPIIESVNVTAGQVLVGDFSKVTLFYNGGIQLSVYDQNESDPIYGLFTIVSKVRCASRIQVCDYASAFCYDAFTDIITDITV